MEWMRRWSQIGGKQCTPGPLKRRAGQFLELEGTFEFCSLTLLEKTLVREGVQTCVTVLFFFLSSYGQENEAQLSLKNCHSKQGPIKLFDRVDAISSNHFKIRPSILSYSISSNLDSNPVKYKKASSFHS